MSKIQFEDKETLNIQPDIVDKNKITADNVNEIKNTINQNDDNAVYKTNVKGNYEESDTNVYNCNYINKITKKVATARLDVSLNNVVSPQIIAMDNIVSNTTLLTLENGGIKIGAGVSKVLVSANYFGIKETNDFYLWSSIKNGTEEVSISIVPAIAYFGAAVHSPKMIEVNEGDIIYLYKKDAYKTDVRGANSNTWLTVEIVE